MRIAICSQGPGMESMVDKRFGRCAYFVVIDTAKESSEFFSNPGAGAAGGAGPQTAQLLGEKGVNAVLAGNVGPRAISALSAGRIEVYLGISGTVADALEQYRAGKLSSVADSTVSQHFGLGQGMGTGRGMGGGRGTGGGRGRGNF